MRGRIGIAHLSNFGLGVTSLFEVLPSTPVSLMKIWSVIQQSVGCTSARLPAGHDLESEFLQNSFLFVTTYFYAHSYGASTENSASLFFAFAHKK